MALTTTTPNMNLVLPTPSEQGGPQWAIDLNACLTTVDTHDHSSGYGVPITPTGLSINADLPMGSNNLTGVRTIRFNIQPSTPALAADLGCLYEKGADLYYIDGSGNDVRITQGGAVTGASGTITGLPSGTASAAYNSGSSTFVFQSATNVAANMDVRSIILRNSAASSKGLTLNPPAGMAADIAQTLPTTPGAQNIMTMDSGGNMAASWNVDSSTIVVASNVIKVPSSGITATQLAASVAGNGLSGGAGTALAVNVDNSTLEITTDILNVKGLGIGTAQLAANAVTTLKILDANVTTAKIADLNVTAAKIANSTITGTQLAASVAGNGLAGGAGSALSVNVDGSTIEITTDALNIKALGVGTSQLAASAVTTAKIADQNVTKAKQESMGTGAQSVAAGQFAISPTSSSGAGSSTTSTSFSLVTNMGVTLVTTGRPIRIELVSDGNTSSGNESFIGVDTGGTGNLCQAFYRIISNIGPTNLATHRIDCQGTGPARNFIPVSALGTTAYLPAGTYTFTVQFAVSGTGATGYCRFAQLVAYEL